jgi:hypothetical protein
VTNNRVLFHDYSRNCLLPSRWSVPANQTLDECFSGLSCGAPVSNKKPILCAIPADRSIAAASSRPFTIEFGNTQKIEVGDGELDESVASAFGFTFQDWATQGFSGSLYSASTCSGPGQCAFGNWSYDRRSDIVSLGAAVMLRPCTNESGANAEKICWTQTALDMFTNTTTKTTNLPFVSLVFNAGQWAYNTRQAAGFVAFVFGELLFLFTVRTEQPFWHAFYFFNRWFYCFCVLGVCLLSVLIYVPIVAFSMGLSPMSGELVVIVWGFCLILPASSECCKILYRDATRKYHAMLWAQIGPDVEPLVGEFSRSVKLEVRSIGSKKGDATQPLLG